jgi:hypothetical protein
MASSKKIKVLSHRTAGVSDVPVGPFAPHKCAMLSWPLTTSPLLTSCTSPRFPVTFNHFGACTLHPADSNPEAGRLQPGLIPPLQYIASHELTYPVLHGPCTPRTRLSLSLLLLPVLNRPYSASPRLLSHAIFRLFAIRCPTDVLAQPHRGASTFSVIVSRSQLRPCARTSNTRTHHLHLTVSARRRSLVSVKARGRLGGNFVMT